MSNSLPGAEKYALKRDFAASTRSATCLRTDSCEKLLTDWRRLTAQFYLWKETLQYNLHPSVPIPQNARVADVATGSGYVPNTAH